MLSSLDSRQQDKEVKRKLVDSFVDLNQAYRDIEIEITVSGLDILMFGRLFVC